MCITMTPSLNTNVTHAKGGVKFIDMLNVNDDSKKQVKKGKIVTMANEEKGPTDEELKRIAQDEKNNVDFENSLQALRSNNINVFGKGEADFYFNEVSKMQVCTPEEEIEYLKKIAEGDMKARDEFVERNLKLVLSNAKFHIQQNSCFSIMDLIQEGNIGLLKAIERFDISKGYKFSTYATWWIRQAMSRGITDQARTIRIPVHVMEYVYRYKKIERNYLQENGCEPSIEEMAKELNVSVEKAEKLAKIGQEPISLYSPVGDDEDSILSDFIPSKDILVDEQYEKKELASIVNKMLDKLTLKERNILCERFGIGTNIPKTLDEIGQKYNVTRERIRQIEFKALRKMERGNIKSFKRGVLKEYFN